MTLSLAEWNQQVQAKKKAMVIKLQKLTKNTQEEFPVLSPAVG